MIPHSPIASSNCKSIDIRNLRLPCWPSSKSRQQPSGSPTGLTRHSGISHSSTPENCPRFYPVFCPSLHPGTNERHLKELRISVAILVGSRQVVQFHYLISAGIAALRRKFLVKSLELWYWTERQKRSSPFQPASRSIRLSCGELPGGEVNERIVSWLTLLGRH